MWKSMILYVHVTAGLVAGQWPPNPVGPPFAIPRTSLDQRPVLSPPPNYAGQPANTPHAGPCRRRNIDNPGVVFTESGWVPVPYGQPPISTQTEIPPIQPQLRTQSLTETTGSTAKGNKKDEAEQTNPNLNSEQGYKHENENKKVTSDQTLNKVVLDKTKVGQNLKNTAVDKKDYHDTNNDSSDSQEDSLEDVEPETQPRSGNSESNNKIGKSEPGEAYEQAENIFSKCVHASRRSMTDLEGDVRNFEPGTATELDVTSKSETKDNTPLAKSAVIPNKRVINNIDAKEYLQNPAKNAGKWHSGRQVSLLTNGKVCYACSSYYDSSCWYTNATTTVKYCNRENNSCLTKMYKIGGKSILIRDCGHTCSEDERYNIGQKMTSCSICHYDMCNSAYAIHGLHALLVAFVIYTLKFTLQ